MIEAPLIDEQSAVDILRASLPNWTWLLQHLESSKGHFKFPSEINTYIANLKLQGYPRLYENEAAIGLMVLRGFLSPEEIQDLNLQLERQSPSERGQFVLEAISDLAILNTAIEFPRTPAEVRSAEAAFNALSPDEQAASIKFWQHSLSGFLACFHQVLSVAVHGTKLTTLVAHAMTGDDSAFAKAVQIDKRTLTEIPFFRARWSRAQTDGDSSLLKDVGQKLFRAPYIGKLRHKELYLALSFLDSVGLLNERRHQHLLDLLDLAGVGLHRNRIDDVKNLSKRLTEYRRFQRSGIALSTP